MDDLSPAQKAAETRKRRAAAKKAVRTKTAKKVAGIVKNRQWDNEIVVFLRELKAKSNDQDRGCIVCGDGREDAFEVHHLDRERTETVILCSNCHSLVTHGNIDELKRAQNRSNTSA
jgi:hypothetical protein